MRPTRADNLAGTVLRLAADIALVHVCMIVALVLPVAIEVLAGARQSAAVRLVDATRYYTALWWLITLAFPLTFALCGFYSHSRAYASPYKLNVIARGTALAVLLFLAANFLLFRHRLAPRSSLVLFCVLASGLLPLARLLTQWLGREFEIKPRRPAEVRESPAPVLVVGGAGYIGSTLVRKLLDAGHKVRVLDSLVYGDRAIRAILGHPNLELLEGDCRNIQNVVAAVRGVGAIVHLAAIVGDSACEQERQTALETNYAATRMIIEVAKGHGVSRFIFASSCSVYGATDLLMDENSRVQPISFYGRTKVDSEGVLLEAQGGGLHVTILRLATVFGLSYRNRFDLVVNLLAAKAHTEGIITVFNGEQWRPFIHVDDVAEGMIQVLNAPLSLVSGEVFNLGDTRFNFTLSDVSERIVAGFPGTNIERVANSDRRNYRVSFEKIRNRIGFRCSITLEAGIRELQQALDCGDILDYRDPRYNNQKYLQVSGTPARRTELDTRVMAAFAEAPSAARSHSPI